MIWTGLAADAWDPSGGDSEHPDLAFIRAEIERNGGAALDVGAGTGRLLLRLLDEGYDVEGIEPSADMIALCTRKGRRLGLEPQLYQQTMEQLDLPRRYGTIFIPCGTFCLITDRAAAADALRRLHDHLKPGGALLFNLFWPFAPGEPLSDEPDGGDNEWGVLWSHEQPDGSVIIQHLMRLETDPVEQLLTARRRYRRLREGEIVDEQIFEIRERWYFPHEMTLMLERAGFDQIELLGGWHERPFDHERDPMLFRARRATG